ncbi:hypothetical protein L207DRAFT_527197 [Hyaloscypha variabilis F]|uniref:Uncharacterized protein n=1 Tax=Hyaloscypha variabilis (strain UAMH 11265 / GT02V1 / F) TaxID=1149755 RepID=A0A2J6RUS3_HYAVF|nr:hypothetical protein L207DRAFT_527197 [Hyaloscypha variabilis F]
MLPFKLYISLCATFLQATSVLSASSTSKSTIASSAAPSTSTALNQATSTSSNTFIPLPTGDQPAVPSKYPSIQELADYFQISPGCAACMVPPLGPYAGGLEDSRCTGYAMKDLCTSSSTETPGVLACDPPYSSNEHCYIYNCSTPDIQRLFYPQTCQDNYDPAYNEIAHLAEYCLDLGVSYANVSAGLNVGYEDPRSEQEILADIKAGTYCLYGGSRSAGALTAEIVAATDTGYSTPPATTATASSKGSTMTAISTSTTEFTKSTAASYSIGEFGIILTGLLLILGAAIVEFS